MGMFAGLDADKYDRQYTDWQLIKRIFNYFGRYRALLVAIVAAFTILAFVASMRPVLISAGVDALENDNDILKAIIFGLFLVAVFEYTANWIRRLFLTKVVGNTVANMRRDAFQSAIYRDLAFYDEHKTGKVVSRITTDTQEFGDVVIFSSDVLSQLISLFVLLFILLNQSVTLTLILLATLPMFILATLLFRRLARIVTRQGSRMMAKVNDNIQESVTGISVAKNFRKESMIYEEFLAVNSQSYQINLRRGFVLALVFPVMNFLIGIGIAIVLYSGATFVVSGLLSAGAWFLFIQGVDRLMFPVINLAAFWSQFQQGLSATERIFGLIDAENTIIQTDQQIAPDLKGHIEIKNVTFEYKTDQPILEDFSLDIKPGESIAFVGHTGAGKSTLAKLVSRFYEFQEGEVLIDGHDIRSFNLASYRKHLGIVAQQPFLFSGTVIDNIRYSRTTASDEEILRIANTIGDGEWIDTLPNGLYSDVGERGSKLSVGQRQLVSLMRVLVQKPSIFILDEATASIDPFTEMQIQEAIDLILQQSTSILIAHRLSTVRSADRIIVLKDGHIIEQGNHDQLIASGGHYAELYNTYFRHQSLSYIESAHDQFNNRLMQS
ncbi:ABC transporter ATP-binding protein [Anaerolineales bacterium]